jgi:hypothetical protein
MNEVISNYKKLRFYVKNSNIPFDVKDIGIKNYNTNEIRITYKGWTLNTWWDILDDCLVWDKTKEGLYYWYEQHLNLVYYAMLVSGENLESYFCSKISRLLERCPSYEGAKIKTDFIQKCKENKIINKEIISKWKAVIKKNEEVYF